MNPEGLDDVAVVTISDGGDSSGAAANNEPAEVFDLFRIVLYCPTYIYVYI